MQPFYLSSSGERLALLLTLFVITVLLMMLMFISSGKRNGILSHLINTAMLLSVFSLLVLTCMDQRGIKLELNVLRHFMLPMPLLWSTALIFGAHAVCVLAARIRRTKNQIDRDSIREALNTLPAAVCYFNTNGMVKLCNPQMHRLYREMTHSDLQTLDELHDALEVCSVITDVRKISDSEPVWLFPDGRAWMFSEAAVSTYDGNVYAEAIFTDVTELYIRNLELQKQTEQLKEINRNIRTPSANVAAMTKEEEMLSLKTKLHDRLGAGIVAARQAILQNRSSEEMDTIIDLWCEATNLVSRDNELKHEKSELNDLMRDADAIGVRICMGGDFPQDSDIAAVFLDAIQECLTNCVRHAGGTEVYVHCGIHENEYNISITNNGKAPQGEIIPGGGLLNLEKQVLRCGGIIRIQSQPEFKLSITVAKIER